MSKAEKRLLKASKAQRPKSDSLTEEVRTLTLRLKERPEHKCSVCLILNCRSRYKNMDLVWVIVYS